MKKQGFTLIELIAVIAILGLILAVSIPGVMGIIESNTSESYILIAKSAVSSARVYVSTNNTILPTDDFSALLLTFEDMELNYENITNDISVDSSKSYVLIDEDGNYYVTVISSNGKRGIINLLSSKLDEESSAYMQYDSSGELITADPKTNTSFNVDTNGDGIYNDVELSVFTNIEVDTPITFGGNNPIDDSTTNDLTTTFEIYYQKEDVKEIILTINSRDYYLYSSTVGETSGKPGRTCKEIKSANSNAENGQYYIEPESTIIQTYCDMSLNGGMMLLDNFKGSKGSSTDLYGAAIGGSNINSSAGLTAAGWTQYLTHYDYSSYLVADDYYQLFYTGTPIGFIYKTLPGYANKVKVDWANWFSGTSDHLMIGDTIVQSPGSYAGEQTYEGRYKPGDTIYLEEGGIFWIGEVWVYEDEDNLINSSVDDVYSKITYTFTNLVSGENTYQAKVIYNDDSYETTSLQTINADGCNYVALNGRNQYIKLPSISSARTICMHTYIGSFGTTWGYLFDARAGYSNSWFARAGIGTGTYSAMYIDGVSVTTSWENLPKEQWTHFCLPYDGIFTDDLNIFSNYLGGESLSGMVSEIAIFSGIPSAAEAAGFADGTLSYGSGTGLRAWYKINEGTGSTLTDSSGNGYNATIYNGQVWGGSSYCP